MKNMCLLYQQINKSPKSNYSVKLLVILMILLSGFITQAQQATVKLMEIQKRYIGKWPKTMTYIEDVNEINHLQESKTKNYYAASFPNLFRKDLNNIEDGDAEIWADGDLQTFWKYKKKNHFTNDKFYFSDYIVGHFYFDTPDQIKERFAKEQIDITKMFNRVWKGKKVIVIGSSTADTSTYSQVWFDAIDYYPVRHIFADRRMKYDYQYENEKIDGAWFPKQVTHYRNSRFLWKKTYSQVKRNIVLDPEVFSIENFGSVHWHKP